MHVARVASEPLHLLSIAIKLAWHAKLSGRKAAGAGHHDSGHRGRPACSLEAAGCKEATGKFPGAGATYARGRENSAQILTVSANKVYS